MGPHGGVRVEIDPQVAHGRGDRDQIVKIARLTGCKNFVGKRKKFIFNAFVERFENGSDM